MKPSPPKLVLAGLLSMTALLLLQISVSGAQEAPKINWAPPLEPPVNLVNLYRQPNSDYSAGHRGIDYRVEVGQPVLSPADGEVWFSGKVGNRQLISLKHPDGNLTEFEPVCTDLEKGEPVFLGQEIGQVCKADSNYRQHCQEATCLHFSIRQLGEYLSPQVFIGGINPSRLLAQTTQSGGS
jgi:murein DD-endopeptidase MepM/ murein hydrolase activator NlpD